MKDDFTVLDTGERRIFSSGAQRDRGGGKSRPDLISPYMLERLARHLEKGASKYSAHNWAKGIPSSEFWASLNRHMLAAAKGDTEEDHLSAIIFNAMGIVHNQEMKNMGAADASLNDWPVDWAGLMRPQPNPPRCLVESLQGAAQ